MHGAHLPAILEPGDACWGGGGAARGVLWRWGGSGAEGRFHQRSGAGCTQSGRGELVSP